MEKIKNVYIKRNVEVINVNHGIGAFRKKGVLIVEDIKGKELVLDLTSCGDITNCDYMLVRDTKKTKKEYIFKNLMYDTERLAKMK